MGHWKKRIYTFFLIQLTKKQVIQRKKAWHYKKKRLIFWSTQGDIKATVLFPVFFFGENESSSKPDKIFRSSFPLPRGLCLRCGYHLHHAQGKWHRIRPWQHRLGVSAAACGRPWNGSFHRQCSCAKELTFALALPIIKILSSLLSSCVQHCINQYLSVWIDT